MYIYTISLNVCHVMWLKVLNVHLTVETLDISKDLTMTRTGKTWHAKFFEGDRVYHFDSKRQGTVTATEAGNSHMDIMFDDGYEQHRRKTAFIKGEYKKTWKRTWKWTWK